MADTVISQVGIDELPLIVELYNQNFRPSRDIEWFHNRYRGRYNVVQLIARTDGRSVGFFLGFEWKPDVFFAWFFGVLPEYRRQGIATQLMDAAHAQIAQSYKTVRLECMNTHRPLLHLAMALQYDVVGIRWDAELKCNLVLFEKTFQF